MTTDFSSAARRSLLVLAAIFFLWTFYWRGLDTWFYQDDFGWLHLGPAKSFGDFLNILFAPKAHGNLRPWSENLYFYGLKALFGVNPLPFRIVVFATVSASFFVLFAIVHRLTGKLWCAAAAPFLWLANPNLAPGLSWTCIFNQPLSSFFFLLALWMVIERRWTAVWVVFVLGLGSLETVIVFPAIAAVYLWLYDRPNLRRSVGWFALSVAYAILHFAVAPSAKTGPYAIQVNARILRTLWSYVEMALGPERLAHFYWMWPAWIAPLGTAVMLAAFVAVIWLAGRTGVLGVCWFLLILAPVLVLPDHVMDYLLFAPAVGLALVLCGALARHPKAVAPIAIVYAVVGFAGGWHIIRWHHERSHLSRDLVLGVLDYDRQNPGHTLLLTGMSTDQFVAGYMDLPFEPYGKFNIHLAPGADAPIQDSSHIAHLYVLKRPDACAKLAAGSARVLDVSTRPVRDVTVDFSRSGCVN